MLPEVSFYHYWLVLRRRRQILIMAFLAALVTCAVYIHFQPTIYQASAFVRLLPQTAQEQAQGLPPVSTYVRQELTSADVAQKAALRAGLVSQTATPAELAAAAAKVLGLYAATAPNDQGIIRVDVRHGDRIFAAELANAVAEAFVERTTEEAGEQVRQALGTLAKRTEQVQKSMAAAEQGRQAFLEKNAPTATAEALASRAGDMEFKKKELLAKYTPLHPDVIAITRQLAQLRAEQAMIPARETELSHLSRDVRINEELFTTLSAQLEQLRGAASSISPVAEVADSAIPPLSPVSPDIRRSYATSAVLGLVVGLLLAFFFETLDLSISNIEELERFIQMPVIAMIPNSSPQGGMSSLRDRLRSLLRHADSSDGRSLSLLAQYPKTKIAEPYHALRANLLSKRTQRDLGVSVLIASASSGEGKSICSLNFALAAATSGLQVLLVDMDMRRPTLHHLLGLERGPGFSDIMADRIPWAKAARGTAQLLLAGAFPEQTTFYPGIDNLKIITAGTDVANKMDIFENPRIPLLVKEWKTRFDFIVFDTPPVLLFVDALLLARSVDQVVLLYGAGKVTRMALKRAKDQLQGFARDKLVGIRHQQPADDGHRRELRQLLSREVIAERRTGGED